MAIATRAMVTPTTRGWKVATRAGGDRADDGGETGRRTTMMLTMLMMTMMSSGTTTAWTARARAASANDGADDFVDPSTEARRRKMERRVNRMRRVDAASRIEREARDAENERARVTYAEFAAKKKAKIRLEREGELTAEEIEREAARQGEMARERARRGAEAERAELREYEELLARRRREAAMRAENEDVGWYRD